MENNIIDFIDYCGNVGRELPVPAEALTEVPQATNANASENRARTGAKEGLYPQLYFAGQYPDLWKIPIAADAMYYQKYKNKSTVNGKF